MALCTKTFCLVEATDSGSWVPVQFLPACSWRWKPKVYNCWLQVRAASTDIAGASLWQSHSLNCYASPSASARSKLVLDVEPGVHVKDDENGAIQEGLSITDASWPLQRTETRLASGDQHDGGGIGTLLLAKGRLADSRFVYRQMFIIRSYEVQFDKAASVETITNLFQETALNHVGMMDFVGDGMGTTHEMTKHCLIWIVTRLHIEVEKYPIWGDVVQIDSWVGASGKNGMKRDFLVRDYRSGCILARGTSNWAMMNKVTRRLSKMPDAVRAEISPYFHDRSVMEDSDFNRRIPVLDSSAPYKKCGLVPKLQDLDMNQHVNHVKYIDWILECVPTNIRMSCDLKSIILEYRRECGPKDMVESLLNLKSLPPFSDNRMGSAALHECTHLLRLQECRTEVLRARTQWRPKACS